jgi:AcrR family transcriptional regulator
MDTRPSPLDQFKSSLPPVAPVDGRRRRSDASRAKIVAALLDLIREGDYGPSAEVVADRAGVGRRTVFRHFKDMDSLYGEMQAAIWHRVEHIVCVPVQGRTWRERLDHVIDLRARFFEEVLPFKDAAEAHRFRSTFLRLEHEQSTQALRDMLLLALPKDIQADPLRREALDLVLSLEAWRRLRRDQRLSPKAALSVLRHLTAVLVG